MNYRKFYQDTLGVNLCDQFHVHHIDHDRKNNDILNLVAVPNQLHHRYHHYYNLLDLDKISKKDMRPVGFNKASRSNHSSDVFLNYVFFHNKINEWIGFRDQLLGISNISYNFSYSSDFFEL